jgi:hypothetical protein
VVPAQPLADEFATQVAQGAEPEPAKRPPFTAPIRLAEVGAFEEIAEAPAFEEVGSQIEMEPAFEEAEPVAEPAFEVGAPPAEPAFEETPLPAEPAFEAAAPELAALARDLLARTQAGIRPVRLVGLGVSSLIRWRRDDRQLELFSSQT